MISVHLFASRAIVFLDRFRSQPNRNRHTQTFDVYFFQRFELKHTIVMNGLAFFFPYTEDAKKIISDGKFFGDIKEKSRKRTKSHNEQTEMSVDKNGITLILSMKIF